MIEGLIVEAKRQLKNDCFTKDAKRKIRVAIKERDGKFLKRILSGKT